MTEAYHAIGPPIKFGKIIEGKFVGIVVQPCAMTRQIDYEPPEPKYPFKLGYIIKKCDKFTRIEDFYKFIEWQLEFEKKVRFLDYAGKIIDTRPNSRWKEKHLEPLEKLLKRDKKKT